MTNIFITRSCNLNCSYCFADEFVNKEYEEMSVENFVKALDFIKKDGTHRIGIIGGEPTVHSSFGELLKILVDDDFFESVLIYTNGLEIHKYKKFWNNKKFHFLVNCNSPQDIGDEKYEKLKSNLEILKEVAPERICLAINLYSKDFDYSYIFDLLKKVGDRSLRYSISLSNDYKEKTKNILEDIKEIKPMIIQFFKDCIENEIVPHTDCNALPICLFSPEEKSLLVKIVQLAEKYMQCNILYANMTCKPKVDILPDMTAVRCFGLSKYSRISIDDFKNVSSIKKYFENTFDIYAKTTYVDKSCEDCRVRIMDKCGVCFTYKINKINKIKEIIHNANLENG